MSFKKELLLNSFGHFTSMFGCEFFIETSLGNFIWKNPDYGGNNTMTKTSLSYKEFAAGRLGRDKGMHDIERYCGNEFELISGEDA